MNPRTFCCLLGLSVVLAACGPKVESTISHGYPNMPVGNLIPELFQPLAERNIAFGYQDEVRFQDAFSGRWRLTKYPAWLTPSAVSGSGAIDLTLTIAREELGDLTGYKDDKLQDVIEIAWSPLDNSQEGKETTWKVSADMLQLSGQVQLPVASLRGEDVRVGDPAQSQVTQASQPKQANTARGLLVTYQDQSIRDAALGHDFGRPTLSAQAQLSAAAVAAQRSLTALGIAPQDRQPLGLRTVFLDIDPTQAEQALRTLQREPWVLNVAPNAVLSAQSLPQDPAPQAKTSAISAQKLLAAPLLPEDQYAGNQWAFPMLGYPAVWRDMDANPYQNRVVVAVLDSGVRYDHPDLAGKLLSGQEGAIDFMPERRSNDGDGVDSDPTDPAFEGRNRRSHGTHVTGIIVANWGKFTPPCPKCSDSGVVGASYTAPIKVLPIRVLDGNGNTEVPEVIHGVRYAAGLPVTIDGKTYTNPNPVRVMNLSLGGVIKEETARPLCEAISEVRKKGVLVFAAAGNAGTDEVNYPAGCADAIAVGATTLSGGSAPRRSLFSSYYPAVQLSAPGGSGSAAGKDNAFYNGTTFNDKPFPDEILSTDWDYKLNSPIYSAESGTSQATPQVSALAALLLSKGVTSGAEDTLKRMIDTATDLGAQGRDVYFGYGMINPADALGAPAISERYGVRLQSDKGKVYQPLVLSDGRFAMNVASGTYTLTVGEDSNSNNIYGEEGERRLQKTVTLSAQTPKQDMGLLKLE